jgi:4'-phosphopantetheinyl transferase
MAPAALSAFERILSSSELERARRFRLDQHRNRFITGRALMRTLLSQYLQTEPVKLEFLYNPYGKPFLSWASGGSALNFNLAHSENLALLAINRVGTIGVDVERIRPLNDLDQLSASFFSARESTVFHRLPLEQKQVAFFNLWTRKEAWLKATGEGIGHRLNRVEATFLPDDPARFLSLPGNPQTTGSWLLHDLEPPPGFAAALAAPSQAMPLRCFCWNEEATEKMMTNSFISQEHFPHYSNFRLIKPVSEND